MNIVVDKLMFGWKWNDEQLQEVSELRVLLVRVLSIRKSDLDHFIQALSKQYGSKNVVVDKVENITGSWLEGHIDIILERT